MGGSFYVRQFFFCDPFRWLLILITNLFEKILVSLKGPSLQLEQNGKFPVSWLLPPALTLDYCLVVSLWAEGMAIRRISLGNLTLFCLIQKRLKGTSLLSLPCTKLYCPFHLFVELSWLLFLVSYLPPKVLGIHITTQDLLHYLIKGLIKVLS